MQRFENRTVIVTGSARGMGIGPTGRGGFGLAVALNRHAPNLSSVDAEGLMRRAHARGPDSNTTRGNIDDTLRVDGTPLERPAV